MTYEINTPKPEDIKVGAIIKLKPTAVTFREDFSTGSVGALDWLEGCEASPTLDSIGALDWLYGN
jgi:hypothetical protein